MTTRTLEELPLKIIDGDRGKNYPTRNEFESSGYCIFLSTRNIPDIKFDFSECQFIDKKKDEVLRSGKLQRGDIVFTTRGTVGNLALYDDEVVFNQIRINSGMVILRCLDELDNYFLYCYMRNPSFRTQIKNFTSGSAQPQLPIKDMQHLIFLIPEKEIQIKIGNFIRKLDNKIENLQNQNKILEQMAQAIFKSWFVDFDGVTEFEDSELGKIPKGWKVDNIFNCANYINGSAFRNQDSSPSRTGLPVIKITELKFGITSNTMFTEKNMDSKYHLHNNDILFAWSGSPDTSIDTFIWTGGDAILNQHIHKINLDNIKEKPFIYFLFKYFKKIFIEIARNKQTTGLGHVTLDDMKNLLVVLPNEKFMEYAYKNLNPIFNTICNNIYESQSLTQTRDTLFPKLMSGEIRV